jgi:hypothetical protein
LGQISQIVTWSRISTTRSMQYCILGTCTYSPSIAPRIYLPPICEPASLSGSSISRGTSSGVAWPLHLARRHLEPVMPSCRRIDDFQSRPSPQREAVSSWSVGDFRAMPSFGAPALVSSCGGDIERSGQSPTIILYYDSRDHIIIRLFGSQPTKS